MVPSDEPTQIQPTVPTASGPAPSLTPHAPHPARPGGGGGTPPPPLPPTGGGGPGGGDFGDDGEPPRRNVVLIAGAGIVALIVLFIALNLGKGDDTTSDSAATPSPVASAQAPAATSAGPTTATAEEVPSTPAESTPATTQEDTDAGATTAPGGGVSAGPDVPVLQAGGVTKMTFKQGETITFEVKSDKAQEIHVHGYDNAYQVGAGETKTISFKATITGIFDVEFEETATKIGELTVEP